MNIQDIKHCVCLCLDKRKELWTRLCKQGDKLGINIQKYIVGDGKLLTDYKYDHIDSDELPPKLDDSVGYPTWWARPNAYNCLLCWKEIFQMAYDNGWEHILTLEDDAYFTNDFEKYIQPIEFDAFDMLWLGGYHHHDQEGQENLIEDQIRLLQLHPYGGLHGCLIKRKMFKHLIAYPPIGPMDWIAGTHLSQNYWCAICAPSLIIQYPSHSFVEDKWSGMGGLQVVYEAAERHKRL